MRYLRSAIHYNGAKENKNEKLLLMSTVPSCQHLGEFFIPPAIHFVFLSPTLPTSELRNSTHSSERKVAFFSFLSSSSMGKVLARGR